MFGKQTNFKSHLKQNQRIKSQTNPFNKIMKSVRNKKTSNSSFLSNHDLLQNFRNKSFKLITREASLSELKQGPKKVSLIQKKNYEQKSKENKQNDQMMSNRKMVNPSKGQTQRQKPIQEVKPEQQIQKVIKQLNFIYDQINIDEIELKMILNKNIRKIKEIFTKNTENIAPKEQSVEKQLREKVDVLSLKVDDQSKKIFRYKKEYNELKVTIQIMQDKLNLCERQVSSLQTKLQEQKNIDRELVNNNTLKQNQRTLTVNHSQPLIQGKQSNSIHTNKTQCQLEEGKQDQIEILQNIIETQEELISKQMSDFQAQNQEFLRILQTQALQIEQMITNKQNYPQKQQKHTPKHSTNDQRSTAFQSKYDSGTTFRGPIVNGFSNYNSPQRTEDLIAKMGKKKPKAGDFSICLY